jgi:hypothetical protein
VILFIFEFGLPPFTLPNNGDLFYRFLMKNKEMKKFFFKIHPATKELYKEGKIDEDLIELLCWLLE